MSAHPHYQPRVLPAFIPPLQAQIRMVPVLTGIILNSNLATSLEMQWTEAGEIEVHLDLRPATDEHNPFSAAFGMTFPATGECAIRYTPLTEEDASRPVDFGPLVNRLVDLLQGQYGDRLKIRERKLGCGEALLEWEVRV